MSWITYKTVEYRPSVKDPSIMVRVGVLRTVWVSAGGEATGIGLAGAYPLTVRQMADVRRRLQGIYEEAYETHRFLRDFVLPAALIAGSGAVGYHLGRHAAAWVPVWQGLAVPVLAGISAAAGYPITAGLLGWAGWAGVAAGVASRIPDIPRMSAGVAGEDYVGGDPLTSMYRGLGRALVALVKWLYGW